ncbi:MAG: SAM-dependent chlorinase/fluorinase [Steroidobacteraceae bacterium]
MSSWHACGLITLTTDYGLQDPFVGVVKGSILRRFAAARIVDLTHVVPAFQPRLAGFWLARSSEYFPDGSVHVAVVDPGVGTPRRILALHAHIEGAAHCWLAPDNGLLAPVLARVSDATLYDCDIARFPTPSATFHGRDLFAPLAAELASGARAPAQMGPTVHPECLRAERASRTRGSVIVIDHFGNLITDLDGPEEAEWSCLEVHAGARRFAFLRTYGDAATGEYLALVNAFGVVEIARREGNAALGLGLVPGCAVALSSKS